MDDATPDALRLVALLAGLGGDRHGVVRDLAARRRGLTPVATCIDLGAEAMVAVMAPGPRTFDVHVAVPEAGASHQAWTGLRATAGMPPSGSERRLYRHRGGAAAEHALAVAAAAGSTALSRFEGLHAAIGPSGRIYSVGHDDTEAAPRIAWQIDRDVPPRSVFERCGHAADWPTAIKALSRLEGTDLTASRGPWSLSFTLDDATPGVRIGETRWARNLDNAGKRQRLAAWIDSFGGDGAYASALYQLLLGLHGTDGRHVVGRAVEVDVIDGSVIGVAAYLAMPTPSHIMLPAPAGTTDRSKSCPG